ncbi:MAG TPA: hypothetical protein PK509_12340 [Catalimonadaceae bacterium]|nr:hypothetical protein [Catalimonadaceae bacterium]
MTMDWQWMVVAAAGLASMGFLLKRMIRLWKPVPSGKPGCGGRCSCDH